MTKRILALSNVSLTPLFVNLSTFAEDSMKRVFQATAILALIIITVRPAAGQLTINGDVSVASNLTSSTISGGAGTLTALAIRNGTSYLSTRVYGPEYSWIQSYANTNAPFGTPNKLGLNPYGGQVAINTLDSIDEDGTMSSGVTVGSNAKFEGDVEVDGKLNTYGGMDPPYLLLDSETRSSIATRVAREVPPSKQTGAALFWNSQTKQLEVYVASEGAYYDLTGKLLVAIKAAVAADATVIRSYRIDPATGGIVARESMHAPRWQLKPGYRFNSLTGLFTPMGSESNATPETVSAQEALELR